MNAEQITTEEYNTDYYGEQFAPVAERKPWIESVALNFVQQPTIENFVALKNRVIAGGVR